MRLALLRDSAYTRAMNPFLVGVLYGVAVGFLLVVAVMTLALVL